MQAEFGFNKDKITVTVPDKNYLTTLVPNKVELDLTGEAEVVRALQNPIGSPRFKDIVKKGEKIAIITSDITRPMPSYEVVSQNIGHLFGFRFQLDIIIRA